MVKQDVAHESKGNPNIPLRILFAHNSLPEYRVSWFREMSKICEIKFIITNPKLAKITYGYEGELVNVECVKLSAGLYGYKQLLQEVTQIKNYDFVELPPIDSPEELIKSIMLYRAARKTGVKIGYFWEKWEAPRNMQPLMRMFKNDILRLAGSLLFLNVDVVFSSGSKNKEYFINAGVDENKIAIIPDSTEIPKAEPVDIRAKHKIPLNKKLLLYFGRITKQKGLDILIEAIARLPVYIKDKCFLLVAGNGEFKETCEKYAVLYGLSNVSFIGSIDPEKRISYFEQCDIFIHPGTYLNGRTDVWGLTLNEAVQCGKIIISTDAVGSAYDLINAENGVMVQAGNVSQLTNAIIDCVSDETLAEKAKIKNAHIYKIYNVKNMANSYIRICRDICRKTECKD